MMTFRVWIDDLPASDKEALRLLRLTATGSLKEATELRSSIDTYGTPVVIVDGVAEEKAKHFLSALEGAGGKGRLEASTVPNPMVLCAAANRLLEQTWWSVREVE